jgi:hypothetical protein
MATHGGQKQQKQQGCFTLFEIIRPSVAVCIALNFLQAAAHQVGSPTRYAHSEFNH